MGCAALLWYPAIVVGAVEAGDEGKSNVDVIFSGPHFGRVAIDVGRNHSNSRYVLASSVDHVPIPGFANEINSLLATHGGQHLVDRHVEYADAQSPVASNVGGMLRSGVKSVGREIGGNRAQNLIFQLASWRLPCVRKFKMEAPENLTFIPSQWMGYPSHFPQPNIWPDLCLANLPGHCDCIIGGLNRITSFDQRIANKNDCPSAYPCGDKREDRHDPLRVRVPNLDQSEVDGLRWALRIIGAILLTPLISFRLAAGIVGDGRSPSDRNDREER